MARFFNLHHYTHTIDVFFDSKYFPNKLVSDHSGHDEKWLAKFLLDSQAHRYDESTISKNKRLCGKWECFKLAVEKELVEFRDISKFGTAPGKEYEDKTSFLEERYSNSNHIATRFFKAFYNGNNPIDSEDRHINIVGIVAPVSKNIKYNGYKKYAVSFPSDKKKYDKVSGFWDDYSTTSVR